MPEIILIKDGERITASLEAWSEKNALHGWDEESARARGYVPEGETDEEAHPQKAESQVKTEPLKKKKVKKYG